MGGNELEPSILKLRETKNRTPTTIRWILRFSSISIPKSSNYALFSNLNDAKNRSMGISNGSFGTDDPKRTRREPAPPLKSLNNADPGGISHLRITYQNDNFDT